MVSVPPSGIAWTALSIRLVQTWLSSAGMRGNQRQRLGEVLDHA